MINLNESMEPGRERTHMPGSAVRHLTNCAMWSGMRVTIKPVLSDHSKRTPKIGVQRQLSLNAGKVLQNSPKRNILQYF